MQEPRSPVATVQTTRAPRIAPATGVIPCSSHSDWSSAGAWSTPVPTSRCSRMAGGYVSS